MSNKKVTIPIIKEFNPCQSGLDNLIKHYPKLNMLMSEFLALEQIPYNDKIWLTNIIVDRIILKQWAVECAEQVLSNYNELFPKDNRLTDCIETTKRYLEGNESIANVKTAMFAARSAAKSTESAITAWGAKYAAMSAAWAADSAMSNTGWSAEAAADWAAESAKCAAVDFKSIKFEQTNINLSLLIALIDNFKGD